LAVAQLPYADHNSNQARGLESKIRYQFSLSMKFTSQMGKQKLLWQAIDLKTIYRWLA
jgi:hypothetical protein